MLRLLSTLVFSCFVIGCDSQQSSHEAQALNEVAKNLEAALAPVDIPIFSPTSFSRLGDIQSPFLPRKQIYQETFSMESFVNLDWRLVGEVKKESDLLGVFLRSPKGVYYFGDGLPLQNRLWYVYKITRQTVIFEDAQRRIRSTLVYRSLKDQE